MKKEIKSWFKKISNEMHNFSYIFRVLVFILRVPRLIHRFHKGRHLHPMILPNLAQNTYQWCPLATPHHTWHHLVDYKCCHLQAVAGILNTPKGRHLQIPALRVWCPLCHPQEGPACPLVCVAHCCPLVELDGMRESLFWRG